MIAETNNIHSKNEAELFPSLYILGVCGSIGSGKSYACSLLKDKLNELQISSYHLDTDSIAHGVYAPGSQAIYDIAQEFGEHVIMDGNVDRKALGAIVFSDPARMSKLEQIVWPHVKNMILQKLHNISEAHQDTSDPIVVVVEAAVLLDANWDYHDLFDAIWIIRASEQTSVERLVNNRGMSTEDALKRINAQLVRRGMSNYKEEHEAGNVTHIIFNDGRDLWDEMKRSLMDPSCWKNGRRPKTLEKFFGDGI